MLHDVCQVWQGGLSRFRAGASDVSVQPMSSGLAGGDAACGTAPEDTLKKPRVQLLFYRWTGILIEEKEADLRGSRKSDAAKPVPEA